MKLMITCGEATDFISKKEERKLSLLQKVQLRIHLYICELCKLFSKQNKIIIKSIPKMHEDSDASLDATQKNEMIEVLKSQS